jgi:hypothetical protein
MGKPHVCVNIEPGDATSVFYLILAPKSLADKPAAQISLKLLMYNLETQSIHLNLIKISFVGQPSVNDVSIPVDINIDSLGIVEWHFDTPNNLILPFPTPQSIILSLDFDGFSDPLIVDKTLSAYQTTFSPGSYAFPAKVEDLRTGEYWGGRSAIHAPAGDASQLFAYDLDVIAYDVTNNAFTHLLPNGSESNNADHRIWGKPIYAMADGKVVCFLNDQPTNPDPPVDLSPPGPVEGNNFYIQHGDELVLYAHMQEGSLNPNLLQTNATVNKGDFLGLAGNSGNSSRPHLHISAIRGKAPWSGPLRPISFHEIQVLDIFELQNTNQAWPPPQDQPWVSLDGQGLSATWTAIWPALAVSNIKPILETEMGKWKAVIYILFGGTTDAGGLGITPGGKPVPIGPWDPLRHLSPAKRDILLGLAVTEIASIVSDPKSKSIIEGTGTELITNALKKLRSI